VGRPTIMNFSDLPLDHPAPTVRALNKRAPSVSRVQLLAYLDRLSGANARSGRLMLDEAGHVLGVFYRAKLASVFQHVVDARTAEVVGVEALVRGRDAHGEQLSPWQLFFDAADDDQAIMLDRLCRTVHALNYVRQEGRPPWLFLKVHPRLVSSVPTDHGRAFAKVLRAIGVDPRDVVIELGPELTDQGALAAHACANYRWNGFLVGLQFSRPIGAVGAVQSMRPDFVKFDACDTDGAGTDLQRAVGVALEHEARVIVSRCELREDIDHAIALGADFVQGYAVSHPAAQIRAVSTAGPAPLCAGRMSE